MKSRVVNHSSGAAPQKQEPEFSNLWHGVGRLLDIQDSAHSECPHTSYVGSAAAALYTFLLLAFIKKIIST